MKRMISCVLLSALLLKGCHDGRNSSTLPDPPAETTAVMTESDRQTASEQAAASAKSADRTESTTNTADTEETTSAAAAISGKQQERSDAASESGSEEDLQSGTKDAIRETSPAVNPKKDEPIELPIIPIRPKAPSE